MSAQNAADIGIAITAIIIVEMILFAPILLILRFGGPKIALWRITGVKFGSARILDHDGTPTYKSFKMSEVQTKSPPHIFIKGKVRYLDTLNYSKRYGSPCWEYHVDNALPIPITRGFRDVILDPLSVTKAMNTDLLRRLWNLGKEKDEKKTKRPIWMYLFAILGALAMVWLITRLF